MPYMHSINKDGLLALIKSPLIFLNMVREVINQYSSPTKRGEKMYKKKKWVWINDFEYVKV
jgi:hypothetical protein